ncbi:TRAP transporter large permease [Palleronia caenipelagi]|uniref:TRAP transporter large permease protein n=1 Tax=Palleronia caenipelagi TaxID=2489174 RepID=A0A547PK98_9RHOB|nr:TRAP transporter large permease [Palleronia caenipelagi]TRD14585.1 TRAP transporter large permease [Palleronia caenipelagi]
MTIEWPIGLLILLIVMFLGVPVGLAMTVVGTLGTATIIGAEPALSLLGQTYFSNARSYNLSILPMFLMMGNFVVKSGIAADLYDAANAWMRHRKGGLAIATVIACGGFSSLCGSSLATATTMTKIALPSMRRYRYPDGLSTGAIAAGGTLGILIPPSVILVLYGIMTQQDIGQLFLAGIIPGLLGVFLYCAAVVFSVNFGKLQLETQPKLQLIERIMALKGVLGAILLFTFVMGGIYLGIFTPSESAGMGAGGALALTLFQRRLCFRDLLTISYDTAKTTGSMFLILFGALTFSNYVNISGMTQDIQLLVSYLKNPTYALIAITLIYIGLGCVLEGLSMITLTVPIFYPIVADLGYDLIWFGIYIVIVTEFSYITPPVGMNAFVLKSIVTDVSLSTIFKGIFPFLLADVLRLVLVLTFPSVALIIPNLV